MFEIRKDPRVSATQDDFEAQFALRLSIRDKLSEVHEAINAMRALRSQVDGWEKRAQDARGGEAIGPAASALKEVHLGAFRDCHDADTVASWMFPDDRGAGRAALRRLCKGHGREEDEDQPKARTPNHVASRTPWYKSPALTS